MDPNQTVSSIIFIFSLHIKRQEKLIKTLRCSPKIRNQKFGFWLLDLPDTGMRTDDHLKFFKGLPKNFLEASLPRKARIVTEAFVFYIWNPYFGPTQCLKVWRLDHCHYSILESWINSQVYNELFSWGIKSGYLKLLHLTTSFLCYNQ